MPKKQVILNIVLSSLFFIILIVATIYIIIYAQGYKLDKTQNKLIQTGVVSIVTTPTKMDFTFTTPSGKTLNSKSPRSIGSLSTGSGHLKIFHEGYNQWEADIPILPNKSTPIFAHMFLTNPSEIESLTLKEDLKAIQLDKQQNKLFFVSCHKSTTNIDSNKNKESTNKNQTGNILSCSLRQISTETLIFLKVL
jgi:hypothetical protein